MQKDHVRNSSRQNRAIMTSSQQKESNFLPELNDINSREENKSPLSSPKKLSVITKMRGKEQFTFS